MNDSQPLEATILIEVYQTELMDMLRTNLMLKALLAQKDQELAQLKEKSNG